MRVRDMPAEFIGLVREDRWYGAFVASWILFDLYGCLGFPPLA